MPPLVGPRRSNVKLFDMEKLEWLVYRTVKKFENGFTRFDTIHEREYVTWRADRRTDTARRHKPRYA